MARLNIAVEAACQKGGITGYEAGKGPIVQDDVAFLSIYVTDENNEPVTGLKKGAFTVTFLVPVGWGNPGVLVFFDDEELGTPGVYIAKLGSVVLPYGTTYGVKVKSRAAGQAFGMATAINL